MTVLAATRGAASGAHDALDRIHFSLEPIAAAALLWRGLEAQASPSFFQSWAWIGPWLACLPRERERALAVGRLDGRVVALGVLVFGSRGRRGRRTAHLNDSSVADERTPTIEHNGLLRARDIDPRLTERLVRWVLGELADELVLPGSTDPVLGPGVVGAAQAVPAPYVDLDGLRARGLAYRASLSANTRGQLGRALRAYAADGPVVVTPAVGVVQARAFLDRMAALHQARWTARGQPGAFASPFFCRLHETMIEQGAATGAVELLRITAGSTEIGYLHNLIRGRWIAAYQSGFAYESGSRSKPGLVSHGLAIERAQQAGAGRYDFLAGVNQLKQSLANEQEILNWWVIKPARFATRLEYAIISLKSRLKQFGAKNTPNTLLSRRERSMQT